MGFMGKVWRTASELKKVHDQNGGDPLKTLQSVVKGVSGDTSNQGESTYSAVQPTEQPQNPLLSSTKAAAQALSAQPSPAQPQPASDAQTSETIEKLNRQIQDLVNARNKLKKDYVSLQRDVTNKDQEIVKSTLGFVAFFFLIHSIVSFHALSWSAYDIVIFLEFVFAAGMLVYSIPNSPMEMPFDVSVLMGLIFLIPLVFLYQKAVDEENEEKAKEAVIVSIIGLALIIFMIITVYDHNYDPAKSLAHSSVSILALAAVIILFVLIFVDMT